MNKNIFFACTLITIILITTSGCMHNTTDSDKRPLIVGIASGYAPFISLNQQGNYEGFDIDVITAVAQQSDRTLKLVDLGSMASLFMALNQGSIDAIIWGLSITQERCTKVAMINYQDEKTRSYPLLFWNKIPENIQTIADMRGMTICVEPGSSQDELLNTYPSIQICMTEKIDDALLNIQFGKADAALVEPAIATKFMRRYSEIKTLDVPLPLGKQEDGIGIAVKKENTELIKELTQTVDTLKQSGALTTFAQTWGIK